ncbi:MAG: NAD-dependent epimerase/dehydratase family protein, partial [Acidobacteria bacterium]|nr:NAD-dependent epimerase/dehydratase family protein [Acidobacteriota bacterium]MCA1608714.1 NAD-dependent epimerase/dehydratase family protein [Acidobacteriota bacterium]
MKILITGASGLIGRALQKSFREKGHKMLLASREPKSPEEIKWTVEGGFDEPEKLEGLDALIHLAGENIAGMRWTEGKKKAIRDSRVLGTRNLVHTLAE